jgi:TetR/AcrR family transcriptional regulator, transcriptional repressor for nem operon
MKVLKSKALETRSRIIAEAARQFRTHGFSGISVADLMRGIGLTHGGFYAHFSSKEELMALACRHAVDTMLDEWRARSEASPDDALGAIIRPYLSREHRDKPATGCLMAAVGSEAARETEPVRRVIAECLEDVLGELALHIAGEGPAERRKKAICVFASLVGAMVVARAVSDSMVSENILGAVGKSFDQENFDLKPTTLLTLSVG